MNNTIYPLELCLFATFIRIRDLSGNRISSSLSLIRTLPSSLKISSLHRHEKGGMNARTT